jgi:hypothetical protein
MAARVVGDLEVLDFREAAPDVLDQVTLHHLHVVNVILQSKIVRPGRLDDRQGLGALTEKEVRHVPRVDRLDQ